MEIFGLTLNALEFFAITWLICQIPAFLISTWAVLVTSFENKKEAKKMLIWSGALFFTGPIAGFILAGNLLMTIILDDYE